MSEKYLISIAIGPVQDFIASARRSRDLWFGSHLLSELSKVVAEYIVNQKGELIFPSNRSGNVVNKILAIIDENKLKTFETDCREAIERKLHDIYSKKFTEIKTNLRNAKLPESNFKEDVAIAQINDLTEFYWAAVPYDENDKTVNEKGKSAYEVARDRVENLLKARKATRDFEQVNELNSKKKKAWGSNAPKSSLDGQRESVIEDDLIKNHQVKAQKIFGLRKAERLCGVGLLKRLNDEGFFSTSHVASLPLISTLKNDTKTKETVEDYVREISRLLNIITDIHKYVGKVPDGLESEVFDRYDGHLLFENRLADLPFENKASLDEAKKALKIFMKDAFGKENKKPLPYFALLQADGDRMGTIIDNQKDKEEHKKLSEALSNFANDVKDIVENYNGCLIYSGGDDVLAMLPLHTVLKCTRDLAEKFESSLKKFEFTKDGETIKPTLSAGIAIVHHTQPLQESLETMRRAEKEAKSVKGKNALAIISSKRSGADTTIKGSWTDDRNTGKSFDKRLKWFIQLHLDEALPDGAAYQLRDLWLRFRDDTNPKGKVVSGYEKLVEKEAIRILKRKDAKNPIIKEIEKLIENKDFSLDDLAHEIIVARDFKRAYKQAGITQII